MPMQLVDVGLRFKGKWQKRIIGSFQVDDGYLTMWTIAIRCGVYEDRIDYQIVERIVKKLVKGGWINFSEYTKFYHLSESFDHWRKENGSIKRS